MKFEEFKEKVTSSIKDYLPREYAEAEFKVQKIQKPNETYTGLVVWKGSEWAAPSVNLDQFYRLYESGQMGFEAVMGQIAYSAQMGVGLTDMGIFSQYEKAKDRLSVHLCNKDTNADLLEEIPHTDYEDLAVFYRITVQRDENSVSSVVVSNSLLKAYGVTKEQLHQDALANSRTEFPPKLQGLDKMVKNMYRESLRELEMSEEEIQGFLESFLVPMEYPMHVLTNEQGTNGAGALFYPGMMDELGERMGGDYFILPSSIHEVIICPDDVSKDYHELEEIVASVNVAEVAENEVLSDAVYHYDTRDKVFEKAEDFERRRRQKEQGLGRKEEKPAPWAGQKPAEKSKKQEISL